MTFDYSKIETRTLRAIQLEAEDAAERGDAPAIADQAERLAAVAVELRRRGHGEPAPRDTTVQNVIAELLAAPTLNYALSVEGCMAAEMRVFQGLIRKVEINLDRAQRALTRLTGERS